MQNLIRIATALFALTLLVGCSMPRGAALQSEVLKTSSSEEPTFQVVAVSRDNVAGLAEWPMTGWSGKFTWLQGNRGPQSNLIRTGDLLNISIWDNDPNSLLTGEGQKSVTMSNIEVAPNGTVYIPYVEEVRVRGMSASGAREAIQDRMSMISPSAQVQVSVEAGQNNSVDLVGGVGNPGPVQLPSRNYSILSLISQGGGIKDSLKNPIVRLLRGNHEYEIPASVLLSDSSKNVVLRGGDKVVVEDDGRTFTTLGATGRETLIPFPKETINALEAVSIAGGISDTRADPKGILILREYSTKQLREDDRGPNMEYVVFTLDLTSADSLFAARKFQINPGDTVLATESPITAARTIFGLIGSVIGLSNQANSL